jgi:hypothetical protein
MGLRYRGNLPSLRGKNRADPLTLYSRFLRRVAVEGIVPIGFETATMTFESYASETDKKKYCQVVQDAKEYAEHLRRNKGVIFSTRYSIRHQLRNALEDMRKDLMTHQNNLSRYGHLLS